MINALQSGYQRTKVMISAEAVRSEVAPTVGENVIESTIQRPTLRKENPFLPMEYRSTPTDQPRVAEYRRIATAQRAACQYSNRPCER